MRFVLRRGKRPAERIRISLDFAVDLGVDTPFSFTVTATDVASPGTDLSSTLLEAADRVGSVCFVTVKAGEDRHLYVVLFTMTTSSGLVYQHDVMIPVASDA